LGKQKVEQKGQANPLEADRSFYRAIAQANSYLPALFLTIVRVLLVKPEALLLR